MQVVSCSDVQHRQGFHEDRSSTSNSARPATTDCRIPRHARSPGNSSGSVRRLCERLDCQAESLESGYGNNPRVHGADVAAHNSSELRQTCSHWVKTLGPSRDSSICCILLCSRWRSFAAVSVVRDRRGRLPYSGLQPLAPRDNKVHQTLRSPCTMDSAVTWAFGLLAKRVAVHSTHRQAIPHSSTPPFVRFVQIFARERCSICSTCPCKRCAGCSI